MKRDNINYFAVGLFVLTMLALLFYALMRIGGQNQKTDTYYTVFSNISGIKPGSTVAYQGYELGNVHEIEPVQKDGKTSYRLALHVKQGWKVPADSRAAISATGLLSGNLIEIRGGSGPALLAPGATIAAHDGGGLFDAMAGLAEQLSEIASNDAKPLLANLNKRVDKIGVVLEKSVPESMQQLQSVLKKLDNTASAMEALLNAENRQHVSATLKNADRLSTDILQTRKQLDALLEDTHGIVTQNRPELEASVAQLRASLQRVNTILHHLEGASRNTNEMTRQLRQNPSLLIQSKPAVDQSEESK